jgi:hypothetical protein
MLQSSFSSSSITCQPTYNCSSLPLSTCTIQLIINSMAKDIPLTVYDYSTGIEEKEDKVYLQLITFNKKAQ